MVFLRFGLPFLVLSLQFPVAANLPPEKSIKQVNGILGESVLFPVTVSSAKPVAEIEWQRDAPNGLTRLVAEFSGGVLTQPNARNRFGQRLEMANSSTLRIKELEMEDSGLYKARVRLTTAAVHEYFFNLTVYGPIPVPQVLHQTVSNSSTGCNVTLECWLSKKAGLNVSWRIGDDDLRTLEESPDWYQLSSDGWRLHVSVRSNATDSNFTCLVSNPVDQKHVSIDLLSVCPHEVRQSCFSWVRIALAVGLLVEIATVTVLNLLERIHRD